MTKKSRAVNSFSDTAFRVVFQQETIAALFLILLAGFLLSLWNRYIYIDDSWFGEQSLSFLKNGCVKTETIKDFEGWDQWLLVYHKLNIILGAGLIWLFGWSVNSLRGFTLFALGLLFVVLYRFFRQNQEKLDKNQFLFTSFLIFSSPLILLYGFTFRPEILVSLLGFTSFVAIDKYLKGNEGLKLPILAGFLSGIAFLTHLNGLIFGVGGFVLLLIYKKFKAVTLFSIVTALVSMLYFYDLWQPGHWHYFITQLKNWPDDTITNYKSAGISGFLGNMLVKLSQEHQRFFWSYKVWAISSFFILAMITNFRFFWRNYRPLMIYAIALIIALNVAGSQIAERYMIYYLPYLAIIIAVFLQKVRDENKSWLQAASVIILFLHLFTAGLMFQDIFSRQKAYVAQHAEILSRIPDTSDTVLVSYRFVFNEIENRPLATFKGFEYAQVKSGRKLTPEEFFLRAKALNIAYIVIPDEIIRGDDSRFPFMIGGEIGKNPFYEEYFRDDHCLILKRL
jgi:hypothetical protein